MVRPNRIKEYFFSVGSLTAASTGLFDVYSDHVINGTIQNIFIGSNTYTNTGSLLFFASGTNELIMRSRAGSMLQTLYPFVYPDNNQNATGSPQAFAQRVINSTIRVVGSGVGNAGSATGIWVRYI